MGPYVQYYISLVVWLGGLAALALVGPSAPRAATYLLVGVTGLALVFNLFGLGCPVCGARVGLYVEGITPRLPGRSCRRCHHDLRRRAPD